MKKENVKVLIGSKKEAKAVRRVLKVLGEELEVIKNKNDLKGDFIWCRFGVWFISNGANEGIAAEMETITLKQLVQLLASEDDRNELPVVRSEDGILLFEGDKCYCTMFEINGKWVLDEHSDNDVEDKNLFQVTANGRFYNYDSQRVFSTKEAAEAWVAEQNKPKVVDLDLFNTVQASVRKDSIKIINGSYSISIMPSDLEDMLHAYKSLQ